MINRKILVTDLIDFIGRDLIKVYGEIKDVYIDNLADVAHVNEHTLDWVLSKKNDKTVLAERSKAKTILVDNEVVYTDGMQLAKKVLLVVNNPKRILAKIGNHFFVNRVSPGIHPTAIIDPSAILGENVYVGPYSVIGKASIGDNCIIDSNVRIHDGVVLGHDCSIKAGAVLGGEGFGFEKDENGNRFRFPQIGGLLIGNYVEVGANTCIDRGALSDTIIGDYTKINNLCHIAHNNNIGKNVTITGCVNVSGSNKIEDNVWIAPNASIVGYVRIGENTVVGMGSVVVKDIPSNEVWVGNPARKIRSK